MSGKNFHVLVKMKSFMFGLQGHTEVIHHTALHMWVAMRMCVYRVVVKTKRILRNAK